jgi:hypothetical protein
MRSLAVWIYQPFGKSFHNFNFLPSFASAGRGIRADVVWRAGGVEFATGGRARGQCMCANNCINFKLFCAVLPALDSASALVLFGALEE